MRKFLLLGVLIAAKVIAVPVITVTPTLGPDAGFATASPNFGAWAANAINALIAGQTTLGSGISGYTAIANGATLAGNEFISTPFTSWKGLACPACAYNTEYGTAMYFGVHVSTAATTETFLLNQLSVSEIYLGQSSGYAAGFLTNFSSNVVGKGANGITYNSAQSLPNSIALKELWYVGVGFVQGIDPNATGTNQAIINTTWAEVLALANRTTQVCYSLPIVANGYHPSTGCASVNIPSSSVPEPGVMFLLGGGLAGLALLRRRRSA